MARELYWEDMSPGMTWRLGEREVEVADVVRFADLSGDRNPLHLDEGYAAGTVFGRPIAHGVLGLAVTTGLIQQAGVTAGTLVALLAIRWDFLKPLMPGTVVSGTLRVLSRRESRQRDRGVVIMSAELLSESGGVLQSGDFTYLIRRIPRGTP